MMQTLLRPNGVAWRVNREAVLMLGARRALLMQIAHPLVAAAVAAHSDFRRDPFGRLRRTAEIMFALAFGSVEQARMAYQRVDAVHARVRGRLGGSAGALKAGTPYSARDPELLFWVHATLIDSALLVYRRYVGALSDADENSYYQETKVLARLFEIPESVMPEGIADFRAYMDRMLDGPVRVSATARELARGILYPPLPLVPAVTFDAINVMTIGLLPPALREQYGLGWGALSELLFDTWSAMIRITLPALPDPLRVIPAARAAERAFAARRAVAFPAASP